jgi:hypothetical protein
MHEDQASSRRGLCLAPSAGQVTARPEHGREHSWKIRKDTEGLYPYRSKTCRVLSELQVRGVFHATMFLQAAAVGMTSI